MPSRVGSSNAARRDDYCTGIQFGVMNRADFPGECLCGSIDFERIVVQRRPNPPITTDFVACLACRAMYFVPLAADRRDASGSSRRGGHRPATSAANLERWELKDV